MADSPKPSFSKNRRWLIWFNTILGVAAVIALVAMANYLASGYFKRIQSSSRLRQEISPQTTTLLARLTNQVEVTIFFDQQENEQIYSLTLALLKQYSYANPNIRVQSLDSTRSPEKPRRSSPNTNSPISKIKISSSSIVVAARKLFLEMSFTTTT